LTKPRTVALAISFAFNILLGGGIVMTYVQIKALESQNDILSRQILDMRQQIDINSRQLEYYRSQAEYYSKALKGKAAEKEPIAGRREINIVAIKSSDLLGERLEGVTMKAEVELRKGEGRILIDTHPRIGIDLQSSARTAAAVAEEITRVPLQATDIILTVRAEEEVEIVDGPSAGAAIAVALIAAVRGDAINSSILMTGTINPDGSIGAVGGVLEKAIATARTGAKLFVVPAGQSIVTVMRPEEYRPAPGLSIIIYRPEQVNLQQYLSKQGISLTITEAANIQQLYKLATKGHS